MELIIWHPEAVFSQKFVSSINKKGRERKLWKLPKIIGSVIHSATRFRCHKSKGLLYSSLSFYWCFWVYSENIFYTVIYAMLIQIFTCSIVWTTPLPRWGWGESKFEIPPPEGETWKIKKGGGSILQMQVFLKEGGLAFFLFNFLKVYHFCI